MIESKNVSAVSVANHYDDLDEIYREVWGEHLHHGFWKKGNETPEQACLALIDFMAEKCQVSSETELIDVGCGYGKLRREQNLKVDVRLNDWMNNLLPSESANMVYSIESSEHMPDFEKFFSEAARVLKPSGQIAIYAWLESDHYQPWMKRHLLQPVCDEGRMRLGTQTDYLNQLRSHGFSDIEFFEISDKVSRTWTICIRRAIQKFFTDKNFRKYLLSSLSLNREFAKTILRIRLAFATSAMQYGLFTARKI